MRILRLDLLAFGPFTDKSLDLQAGQFGLHVVYGPNEAGKSSALRALRQFFYGIDVRSPDNFLHPYANLRIGAVLDDGDGGQLHALRRKGNKDTLRGADDTEVVDPARLARLLGGTSPEEFRQRFGIDHQELIRGGEEIVRGGGELGAILFAAGAGLANLSTIQKRLADEAEALFKSQGSVPTINRAIKEFDEAVKARKAAQLRPAEWKQHDDALKAADARRAEVDGQLRELRSQQRHAQRLQQALPLLAKRRRLLDELQPLADTPRLSGDFTAQRREATTGLTVAQQALQQAAAAIAEIDQAVARLDVGETLLQHAAAIQQLHELLGAHRKATADRPRLTAQLERVEEDAQTLLQELGRDAAWQDAERWRLSRAERAKIQDLGAQHQALVEKTSAARQRVEQLARDSAQQRRQLQQDEAPGDAESLQRAIRRARRAGDPEQNLAQRRAELRRLEQQAEIDLQRLELWSGPLETLERTPWPSAETVDRWEALLADREAEAKSLEQRAAEAGTRLAQLEQKLERLRREQEVPSEEDLTAARQQREHGWSLVLHSWQGPAPPDNDVTEFVRQWPTASDLARAYQASVERADTLADRLRRESKQVAEKARLMAEQQELQTQVAALAEQRHRQEDESHAGQQQWCDLWRPGGLTPRSPREMRAWLVRQADLVRTAAELRRLRDELAPLAELVTGHREELSRELQQLGCAPPRPDDALADLLEHSEEVVAQLAARREQRRQAERDLARLEEQAAAADQEQREAEAALTGWRDQWAQAVERIELSAAASPAEANEVTNAILELQTRRKEAAGLSERLAGIDRDADQFAVRVREVLAEVAPDLAAAPAERAVLQLQDRLQAAQRTQARLQELQDQRRREEQRRAEAQTRDRESAAVLDALCREAGCERPEQLPGLEQQAQQRRELERQLRDCEDQLLDLAAGTSLEDLIAQTAGLDADQLDAQIAQREVELEALERHKDELASAVGREQAELARMDGSDLAAAKEEEAQLLLAQIRAGAERYVRLRLAAVILQRAVERYREKNQGDVLHQASRWFAALTGESFSGLRDDYDEQGTPVLVGVRGDGRTLLRVDGMSDGTRDQLYLALRLASLMQHLTQSEPIPFIVDDILVQFDDQRAAAALRILAELSDRTQVIFFTHHAHLTELARQHVPADKLFVHPL